MHVEADLHEARHDLLNLFLSRAFLHHHYHAATLQGELPCFRLVRGIRRVPDLLACLAGLTPCPTLSSCRADALPHMSHRDYIAPVPLDGPPPPNTSASRGSCCPA